MGRYGPFTRIAMIVVGAVWAAAGGGWLWFALRHAPSPADRNSGGLLVIPIALLAAGTLLVKTGVTRDRPKTFEEEVPDAHPDLEGDALYLDLSNDDPLGPRDT